MSDNLPSPIQRAVEAGDNVSEVTPARLFIGRTGTAYRTSTQLQLRADHAFAKDALEASLSLAEPPMNELVERFDLFEVATEVDSHEEYLARPDKGRRLAVGVAESLRENCPSGVDVQFVIGDGLSPLAVRAQVPSLLGPLIDHASSRGWSVGRPFFVR